MLGSRRVFINVFSSSGQVIFTGLSYFLLYKLLLDKLGAELLGVWSVVLATTSIGNLANFGISTSVVRFVALYSNSNNDEDLRDLVFTSATFIFVFFVLISALVFPFSNLLLGGLIEEKFVSDALDLLPYSIACLVVNSVTGVYSSVLDGLQMNYVRNLIYIISSVVLLVSSYLLIDSYGLLGLGFAQLIQALFTLIVCFVMVKIILPKSTFKWRWNKRIFKAIFSFGTKFQVISITNMLNDPFTKILLLKFAGLEFIGFYEMANRLVSQLRAVIVNANQSLIPVIISNNSKSGSPSNLYSKTFLYVFISSFTAMGLLSLMGGIISDLWIGWYEPIFIYCLLILSTGYFFNIVSGPSYFEYVAKGKLNVPLIIHILLCVLNSLFGYLLGKFLGGVGVVLGTSIALIFSSALLALLYQREIGLRMSQVFYKRFLWIFIFLSVSILLELKLRSVSFGFEVLIAVVLVIIFTTLTTLIIWKDLKFLFLKYSTTR